MDKKLITQHKLVALGDLAFYVKCNREVDQVTYEKHIRNKQGLLDIPIIEEENWEDTPLRKNIAFIESINGIIKHSTIHEGDVININGGYVELKCKHCNNIYKVYINGVTPITKEKLVKIKEYHPTAVWCTQLSTNIN